MKVASILKEEIVIIEDGQKPGDTVWFKPMGDALRAFQFVVPDGASPGDRVYVQPLRRDYDMSSELNSEMLESIQAQRRYATLNLPRNPLDSPCFVLMARNHQLFVPVHSGHHD